MVGGVKGTCDFITYSYILLSIDACCAYIVISFYAWFVIIKKGENVGT
jgi:hypothetical protein